MQKSTVRCTRCDGNGKIPLVPNMENSPTTECPSCKGKGFLEIIIEEMTPVKTENNERK
ncbi:MAG: hypothetical protein MJZ22_00040 [Candidatus Saccharibacteria bacterium]|nr:hypothetical protein [Candidatus Saccharibacteria bacterium]